MYAFHSVWHRSARHTRGIEYKWLTDLYHFDNRNSHPVFVFFNHYIWLDKWMYVNIPPWCFLQNIWIYLLSISPYILSNSIMLFFYLFQAENKAPVPLYCS